MIHNRIYWRANVLRVITRDMADKTNKYDDNIPGRYFVDKECISCDACVLAAPDHFQMHDLDAHAFVIKQPNSKVEEQACRDAMEGCPVEAIGNDGSETDPS